MAMEPVLIFLPVRDEAPDPADIRIDPVCGRAVTAFDVAGRLLYGGRHHYFCSLGCAEQFAAEPAEFEPR